MEQLPHKDDVLFRYDDEGITNACVNYARDGGDYAYRRGYRVGARLLAQYCIDECREQDGLIYPIVFLYRQHVELALKDLIRDAAELSATTLTADEQKHLKRHDLKDLWGDLKKLLKKFGPPYPDREHVAAVDSYIDQLMEFDRASFSFRYPRTKSEDSSLPANLKHIGIRNFQTLMERLADYLEGLDLVLSWRGEELLNLGGEEQSDLGGGDEFG